MPKKLTELQKREISQSFMDGTEVKRISEIYNFSTQTIIKQLKSIFGEEKYKDLKNINLVKNQNSKKRSQRVDAARKHRNCVEQLSNDKIKTKKNENTNIESISIDNKDTFVEIIPLNDGVDLDQRKDMATIPISDFELPQVVYMIIDKKIELDPRLLKEFPDWDFMPEDDLMRLTLEIYQDKKKAQNVCSNNQKLIKIPNPKVFLLVAEILKEKGISRIICNDSLLSL